MIRGFETWGLSQDLNLDSDTLILPSCEKVLVFLGLSFFHLWNTTSTIKG